MNTLQDPKSLLLPARKCITIPQKLSTYRLLQFKVSWSNHYLLRLHTYEYITENNDLDFALSLNLPVVINGHHVLSTQEETLSFINDNTSDDDKILASYIQSAMHLFQEMCHLYDDKRMKLTIGTIYAKNRKFLSSLFGFSNSIARHDTKVSDLVLKLEHFYATVSKLVNPKSLRIHGSKTEEYNIVSEALLFEHLFDCLDHPLTTEIIQNQFPILISFRDSLFHRYFLSYKDLSEKFLQCWLRNNTTIFLNKFIATKYRDDIKSAVALCQDNFSIESIHDFHDSNIAIHKSMCKWARKFRISHLTIPQSISNLLGMKRESIVNDSSDVTLIVPLEGVLFSTFTLSCILGYYLQCLVYQDVSNLSY